MLLFATLCVYYIMHLIVGPECGMMGAGIAYFALEKERFHALGLAFAKKTIENNNGIKI